MANLVGSHTSGLPFSDQNTLCIKCRKLQKLLTVNSVDSYPSSLPFWDWNICTWWYCFIKWRWSRFTPDLPFSYIIQRSSSRSLDSSKLQSSLRVDCSFCTQYQPNTVCQSSNIEIHKIYQFTKTISWKLSCLYEIYQKRFFWFDCK